jgi:hypothetical protein
VGDCLHDSACTLGGVAGVEDAGSDEHYPYRISLTYGLAQLELWRTSITSELHHQRRVRRRRDASGSEIDNRKPLEPHDLLKEMEWRLDLLGVRIELLLVHARGAANGRRHLPLVANSLDHVASAGLTLSTDESSTLRDTPESLAEVAASTHKWHLESVLVDVVLVVRRCQDLGFVDVV